jgi:hypothetical protein
MLAYTVLNYDIQVEGTHRPPNQYTGLLVKPNVTAKLLVRKRKN